MGVFVKINSDVYPQIFMIHGELETGGGARTGGPFPPPAGGAVIGGGSWKRARCGTDTRAGERERHTHLRRWGQHGAAGWLYLVAGGEGVDFPRSCGRAAGARMWSPLPRRCLDLQHGRRHPRSSQAGSRQRQHTASALATSAPSSRPQDGSSAFSPPAARRGDRSLPAESTAPSATQEPKGRSGRAAQCQRRPRLYRPTR